MYIRCPKEKTNIKVEDLESSIKQADQFRKYGDKNNSYHKKQRNYWNAIYKQLIDLQNEN